MGDDDITGQENINIRMGASNNPNAARIATLKERKQSLEEKLAIRNQELRKLCIQEAELTGVMPTEIPLEPGESPPSFRRRVGTAFQLPQNLINNLNNKEESISAIELEMQVQVKMAEAALGLANEPHVTKTIRRQHMAQYQKHNQQYNLLEEKLTFLKRRVRTPQHSNATTYNQQLKQKKKPRPPLEQDDNVSMSGIVQNHDPFGNNVFRHSGRYSHNTYIVDSGSSMEMRYSSVMTYRGAPDSISYAGEHLRHEDVLGNNLHRMNINSYVGTKDRRGSGSSTNSVYTSPVYTHSHSNPNIYQQQHSPQHPYPTVMPSNTLPPPLRSPQQPPLTKSHPNLMFPHMGPHVNQLPPQQLYMTEVTGRSEVKSHQYYPSHTLPSSAYKHSNMEKVPVSVFNPHQIQPHQQYEHDVMASGGLGGYWRRSENGDMVWCTTMPNVEATSTWQRDKRFGSLDRRKGRRMHKRASPHAETKSPVSALPPVQIHPENIRPVSTIKHRQCANRNRQENRQLVRTQSLGSVGVQTVDSGWPSDDNSSCNSEAPSINELNAATRKLKQKEWYETALDGPQASSSQNCQPGIPPRSRINSVNQSEDIYVAPSPKSPSVSKPPLEIPAESNPSPMSPMSENNMELFNNNVMDLPMNCTVVQAGQCKPYHEETKPFEMSDFYKYSTKFRDQNRDKSPLKPPNVSVENTDFNAGTKNNAISSPGSTVSGGQLWVNNGNVSESVEDGTAKPVQKAIYQPLQPMKCQPLTPPNNFNTSLVGNIGSPLSGNTSLDLSQLTSNVAENFSAEMNAWYKSQEQQVDNNNSVERSPNSRSTATLV